MGNVGCEEGYSSLICRTTFIHSLLTIENVVSLRLGRWLLIQFFPHRTTHAYWATKSGCLYKHGRSQTERCHRVLQSAVCKQNRKYLQIHLRNCELTRILYTKSLKSITISLYQKLHSLRQNIAPAIRSWKAENPLTKIRLRRMMIKMILTTSLKFSRIWGRLYNPDKNGQCERKNNPDIGSIFQRMTSWGGDFQGSYATWHHCRRRTVSSIKGITTRHSVCTFCSWPGSFSLLLLLNPWIYHEKHKEHSVAGRGRWNADVCLRVPVIEL